MDTALYREIIERFAARWDIVTVIFGRTEQQRNRSSIFGNTFIWGRLKPRLSCALVSEIFTFWNSTCRRTCRIECIHSILPTFVGDFVEWINGRNSIVHYDRFETGVSKCLVVFNVYHNLWVYSVEKPKRETWISFFDVCVLRTYVLCASLCIRPECCGRTTGMRVETLTTGSDSPHVPFAFKTYLYIVGTEFDSITRSTDLNGLSEMWERRAQTAVNKIKSETSGALRSSKSRAQRYIRTCV